MRGSRPTVEARCGPRSARRNRIGSWGSLHEIADPHQAVHGGSEGEQPADPSHTTEFDLPQDPHCFRPAENLFDPFALLLTDRIAGMSRGPAINRTGTVRRVLGHMGCDLQRPQILDGTGVS